MASTAIYKCKCCGTPFEARTADRKRGWAKFCSKSCKAIRQTQRTGRAQGGRHYLPNGGWIIGNTEYDRHGLKVGVWDGPEEARRIGDEIEALQCVTAFSIPFLIVLGSFAA